MSIMLSVESTEKTKLRTFGVCPGTYIEGE